jgi:predicted Fe-S protein YdhL (DUF1289 family)
MRVNFPFDQDKASKVPSPCNGKCSVSNVTGLCEGCHRTLVEIVEWEVATDTDKKLIMNKVNARLQK